jgi:hypothetical protein
MAFDPLHFRFTQAAIGSPEEVAATAAEAALGAASPLSQVAIQKGVLVSIGDKADSVATSLASWSAIALLKGIFQKVGGGAALTLATDKEQGSTTAGQSGVLVQGAVTTAAPTYTTAQTNPLSLKTNGDLRVSDAGATAILSTLNLSTDGLEAALGIITETAPATDTASSGLNGRLQRVAQRLTSLIAQIPATLGVKARTASLSVALSTEDAALFPASVGSKAAAASFAVTSSTEDVAQVGSLTETAPATDTASSGLNGRLQRIAQRITSLIALVPASLGQKTMANSFAVTLASDQTTFPTSPGASAATGGIASTSRIVSAAGTTNATSAKASAGRVYAIHGYNAAVTVRYLKLYNKASSPTVGTDTPVKTLALPPTAAFAFDWPHGYSFATGIAYALTTGAADADTGALTAADVVGLNVDYV